MVYVSKKQYWTIKEQLVPAEKKLIDFYELQWFLRHSVPTIEEVARHLGQNQVSVNYYLQRRPVVKALETRGIPWRQHSQEALTATQVAAAVTMSNFADTRSNELKLDQLGILPATYYAWLNDPQFKNLVENLADQNLANIRPTAIGELTKKINAGDWNAVKYYLDVTGAAQTAGQPQMEDTLRAFVEVIQKHVKDPETIMAIATDLKLVSANRTLEVAVSPPQITGEVVRDEELEDAKKKLGI